MRFCSGTLLKRIGTEDWDKTLNGSAKVRRKSPLSDRAGPDMKIWQWRGRKSAKAVEYMMKLLNRTIVAQFKMVEIIISLVAVLSGNNKNYGMV